MSSFLLSPKLLISHSLLATSQWLSSTRSSLLFSKKLILTKKTYLTTDPSQICHSYPSSLSELSLLDLTISSPQTHFSIRTNLPSLNTIPQKLSLSLYITNWSLPSAISKSPVYASSTSLLHLTLLIITSSSSDFPLGSVSLAQLYSGSNPICPLDPSPLKPAATHRNPSHSPVVSLKAPSWAHSFSSCIPPH